MNFEDDFDKIIRQKAEEAEFPYEESNWDKLATLRGDQPAARVVKTSWKNFLLPAAALLIVGGLFLSWYFSPVQYTGAAYSLSESPLPPAFQQRLREISARPAPNSEASAASAPMTLQLVTEDKSNSTGPSISQVAHVSKLLPASLAPTAEEFDSNQPLEALEEETPVQTPSQLLFQNDAGDHFITGPTAQPELPELPLPPSSALPPISNEIVLPLQERPLSEHPLLFQWLPSKQAILQYPVDDREVIPKFMPLPKESEDYVSKIKNFTYSAYAGVHYGLGWSGHTSGGKEGVGINYFGGVDFHYALGKKINLSAGLQYYNFSNILNPYYTAEKREYGFGYTQAFTSVTTDHLMYLAIPLKAGMEITPNMRAGLGINSAYLLAVHTRVDTYGVADGMRAEVSSTGSKTIYEGTRSLNLMGTAFLEIRLTDYFSAFSELQYGFTDLFKNYKHSDKRQNTSGMRVGLNYYFGKK